MLILTNRSWQSEQVDCRSQCHASHAECDRKTIWPFLRSPYPRSTQLDPARGFRKEIKHFPFVGLLPLLLVVLVWVMLPLGIHFPTSFCSAYMEPGYIHYIQGKFAKWAHGKAEQKDCMKLKFWTHAGLAHLLITAGNSKILVDRSITIIKLYIIYR